MKHIHNDFRVTEEEYAKLELEFGKLAEFQAWQLYKKNSKNNHTDDQEDISQEMRISMLKAGAYHKRQVYIEKCLSLCSQYGKDDFLKQLVSQLQYLWKNKKRHGAHKQKFGLHQENLLEVLVDKLVPKKHRPSRTQSLKLDPEFTNYCKTISWNRCKALGRKITKEKSLRTGLVSLSEFDYLGRD